MGLVGERHGPAEQRACIGSIEQQAGTLRVEVDGTTVSFHYNGSGTPALEGTMTIGAAGTGERRAGISGYTEGSGGANDIEIDNFSYGDISLPPSPFPPFPLREPTTQLRM